MSTVVSRHLGIDRASISGRRPDLVRAAELPLWRDCALSLGFFGFFATTIIFPLWLQTTMGYTATWGRIPGDRTGRSARDHPDAAGRQEHPAHPPLRVLSSFSVHRVRHRRVLVRQFQSGRNIRATGLAANFPGSRRRELLHSDQSDHSVRPATGAHGRGVGAVKLLPHAGREFSATAISDFMMGSPQHRASRGAQRIRQCIQPEHDCRIFRSRRSKAPGYRPIRRAR